MKYAVILIIGIILSFLAGLYFGMGSFTGRAVSDVESDYSYSFTKAICSENRCIDVLIECRNGKVIGVKPVSGLIDIESDLVEVNKSDGYCEYVKSS